LLPRDISSVFPDCLTLHRLALIPAKKPLTDAAAAVIGVIRHHLVASRRDAKSQLCRALGVYVVDLSGRSSFPNPTYAIGLGIIPSLPSSIQNLCDDKYVRADSFHVSICCHYTVDDTLVKQGEHKLSLIGCVSQALLHALLPTKAVHGAKSAHSFVEAASYLFQDFNMDGDTCHAVHTASKNLVAGLELNGACGIPADTACTGLLTPARGRDATSGSIDKVFKDVYFVTAEEFGRRFPASRFAGRSGGDARAQEYQQSGSRRSDGIRDDAEEEEDESDEGYEWS
jgi:hypothetical protein